MSRTLGLPSSPKVINAIADRLEARIEAVADLILARYAEEIPEYRALSRPARNDIRSVAIAFLEQLVESLRTRRGPDQDSLLRLRHSAARRVHQGVSMQGLLRAYRIWQEVAWHEVEAQCRAPAERDAALWIAEQLMAHVNAGSTVVAHAYLEELTQADTEVKGSIRRDLLDSLIAGRLDADQRREIRPMIDLDESLVVVVARLHRADEVPSASIGQLILAARACLEADASSCAIGSRDNEVVAIISLPEPASHQATAERAKQLSEVDGAVVGIGRSHSGLDGLAIGYDEAVQALEIGVLTGQCGRAIVFSDVLLEAILRSSHHARALLEVTITPLVKYDAVRNAAFLPTLRAYFETNFSLTHSAAILHVHPNTVTYRLNRIAKLTGRNPSEPRDLLLLILGLELFDLCGLEAELE